MRAFIPEDGKKAVEEGHTDLLHLRQFIFSGCAQGRHCRQWVSLQAEVSGFLSHTVQEVTEEKPPKVVEEVLHAKHAKLP